jgi:oxygen-dependent protoporphyrinogen oxidase
VNPDLPGEILDVAVLGGGIAGLTAAWAADQRGWSVRLLECGRTVGGKVRSERKDGYLVEWGPNSFLGSAAMLWKLVEAFHLEDQVVAGQPPGDRFIYRARRARRLPSSAWSFLSGDYMSLRGKLRMLAEPFALGDAQPGDTVLDFARRRLGAEAAQYLVTPFISGLYAGDPDQLGARDAFPRLWQWEHEAGSMTLGALLGWGMRREGRRAALEEPGRPRRGLYNFREGFGTLPRTMAAALPTGTVQTQSVVDAVEPQPDGTYLVRWHVNKAHDGAMLAETGAIRARKVVIALPPRPAASLLKPLVPAVADALAAVELCRVASIHFGGPDPERIAPQGFGVLIPPGEGLRTLGILMPSSIFPDRAPDGGWLHSGFIGGTRDPDAVDLTDETLLNLVRRAQTHAFGHLYPGRQLECTFSQVVRWRDAIPQYRVGHRESMDLSQRTLQERLPGLTLAGNYLAGVSVNDAALSGWDAVQRIALDLQTSTSRTAP